MASRKLAFSSPTTITWVALSTLANNAQTTSSTIDNSVNLYLQYYLSFVLGSTTTTATGFGEVWISPSIDNSSFASPYTEGILVAQIPLISGTSFTAPAIALPPNLQYFQITFNNQSGVAFTSATAKWLGCYETIA